MSPRPRIALSTGHQERTLREGDVSRNQTQVSCTRRTRVLRCPPEFVLTIVQRTATPPQSRIATLSENAVG